MAQIFPDKTTCALCAETIRKGDAFTGFAAFLPPTHRLWRYSDAAFHASCYESWEDRSEFQELYDRFKAAWEKRPAIPGGMSFKEFEQTKAFRDFTESLQTLFQKDDA